jgi:hypothetical protein
LFSRLQSGLESGLSVEWKRALGRSSKTVCINADFVKLDADAATLAAGGHRSSTRDERLSNLSNAVQ